MAVISERTVRLDGSYPTADLDRLLIDLDPLVSAEGPTQLLIDLRSLSMMSAPAVAVFVAAMLEATARGLFAGESRIVLPNDPVVQKRLEDLGVLKLLANWSSGEPLDQEPARGWRPCQLFSPDQDPGASARSLSLAIAEVCHTESFAGDVIWYTLNEIAQNVVDHSNAHGGAVGIAEVTIAGAGIEVAIADFGVGVMASLMQNPQHASISETEALRIAVSAGGSSRVDPHGPAGLGLYFTRLILRDNGGDLSIRSGRAQLVIGSALTEQPALEHMSGTLVILRFRTDKPVRLESILPS